MLAEMDGDDAPVERTWVRVNENTEFPLDVLLQAGIQHRRDNSLRRPGAVDCYLVWPSGGEVLVNHYLKDVVFEAIGKKRHKAS